MIYPNVRYAEASRLYTVTIRIEITQGILSGCCAENVAKALIQNRVKRPWSRGFSMLPRLRAKLEHPRSSEALREASPNRGEAPCRAYEKSWMECGVSVEIRWILHNPSMGRYTAEALKLFGRTAAKHGFRSEKRPCKIPGKFQEYSSKIFRKFVE